MIGQLFNATSERDSKRGPSHSNVSQGSKNIRRAKLAVQNGQYNKAIMALSSEGLTEPSSSTITKMLLLYSVPPVGKSGWGLTWTQLPPLVMKTCEYSL